MLPKAEQEKYFSSEKYVSSVDPGQVDYSPTTFSLAQLI